MEVASLVVSIHPLNPPPPSLMSGVTFDTGGISIKPSGGMGLMRGDMGGAACVVSALLALAELGHRGKVVALVPLCENMPSGNAVKPGDVVTAMNGKTIEVCVCMACSLSC